MKIPDGTCQYGGCEQAALYQHYFLGKAFLQLCQEHADKVFPLNSGTVEEAKGLVESPSMFVGEGDPPVDVLNQRTAAAFLGRIIPMP